MLFVSHTSAEAGNAILQKECMQLEKNEKVQEL